MSAIIVTGGGSGGGSGGGGGRGERGGGGDGDGGHCIRFLELQNLSHFRHARLKAHYDHDTGGKDFVAITLIAERTIYESP
jgi:hypothetical protein